MHLRGGEQRPRNRNLYLRSFLEATIRASFVESSIVARIIGEVRGFFMMFVKRELTTLWCGVFFTKHIFGVKKLGNTCLSNVCLNIASLSLKHKLQFFFL